MVASNAKPGMVSTDNWDEAKIEQALKTLNGMHIHLRELRSTIPKMQANLGGPAKSAAELATAFKNATQIARSEVEGYMKEATNPENAKVLDRAKQSRAQTPKGITPWRAQNHPDWHKPST